MVNNVEVISCYMVSKKTKIYEICMANVDFINFTKVYIYPYSYYVTFNDDDKDVVDPVGVVIDNNCVDISNVDYDDFGIYHLIYGNDLGLVVKDNNSNKTS